MSNLCLTYVIYIIYNFCYLFFIFLYLEKYVFEIRFFKKNVLFSFCRVFAGHSPHSLFYIFVQQETLQNHVCSTLSACGFCGTTKPHLIQTASHKPRPYRKWCRRRLFSETQHHIVFFKRPVLSTRSKILCR